MNNKELLLKLSDLIKNNPDLPVKVFVNGEFSGEYYTEGHIIKADINEYVECPNAGTICFKDYDDVLEALSNYYTLEEFYKLPMEAEDCLPYYEALPWKKAIIIYVVSVDEV